MSRPTAADDGFSREFVRRGTVPRWVDFVQVVLTLFLVENFVHLRCVRIEGVISKMESRRFNTKLQRDNAKASAAIGAAVPRSERLVWLTETGPMLVGMGLPNTLLGVNVGHHVILKLRPDTGSIRAVKNLTKPRKWWMH